MGMKISSRPAFGNWKIANPFLPPGNIALHLFTHGTRRHYDIESLWALGPEHDELSRRRDPIEELFPSDGEVRGEKDDLLSDLKPLS